MPNKFPRQIANLITEDPDVFQESKRRHSWNYEKQLEAEELEDKHILGDVMYDVTFTAGANVLPGEPMVRYYSDGSGHPGSPDEIEWDILSVDAVRAYDEEGNESEPELTEELAGKLTEALYKFLDDETMMQHFEDDIAGGLEPDPDYLRDARRDEPDYY